jgi:hypothetical protein
VYIIEVHFQKVILIYDKEKSVLLRKNKNPEVWIVVAGLDL